jgi:hypothetical protein
VYALEIDYFRAETNAACAGDIVLLALLYFVAGATLHQHADRTSAPDTTCHVCQALHMPALAAAAFDLIPETQQVAWHATLPQNAAPSDSFALHRSSRAPPAI